MPTSPDRDIQITVRISDDGTLTLLDSAGNKMKDLALVTEDVARRGQRGFSRWQAISSGTPPGPPCA